LKPAGGTWRVPPPHLCKFHVRAKSARQRGLSYRCRHAPQPCIKNFLAYSSRVRCTVRNAGASEARDLII